MSEATSSPVNFVPLLDHDPLDASPSSAAASSAAASSAGTRSPAEPSLAYSCCGTRPRAIRCVAVLLLVCALLAVGLYFNYTVRADRALEAERAALCEEWVSQYHITPDGVASCPLTTKMRLLFNDSAIPLASQVRTGTALTRRAPTVELPAVQVNHSYTFALLDIDFPSTDNSSLRAKTHFLVVNIPGGISPLPLHRGDTLFNYSAPCPLPKPGWHRYVAVVYDQHAVNNVSLSSRNISAVPPVLMNVQVFLSVLVGFDLGDSLLGGTFFYGQFESLTCGLF